MSKLREQLNAARRDLDDFVASRLKFGSEETYLRIHEEYLDLKHAYEDLGQKLAADPQYWDSLEMWRVEISSQQGEMSKYDVEDAEDELNHGDFEAFLQRSGSLPAHINTLLEELGHPVENITAGSRGWRMVVHLTDPESKMLCVELHQRFGKSIDMGILELRRCFDGFMFREERAKRIREVVPEVDPDDYPPSQEEIPE